MTAGQKQTGIRHVSTLSLEHLSQKLCQIPETLYPGRNPFYKEFDSLPPCPLTSAHQQADWLQTKIESEQEPSMKGRHGARDASGTSARIEPGTSGSRGESSRAPRLDGLRQKSCWKNTTEKPENLRKVRDADSAAFKEIIFKFASYYPGQQRV